jgi:hypothetical protein
LISSMVLSTSSILLKKNIATQPLRART